jgi:hypothetical protein
LAESVADIAGDPCTVSLRAVRVRSTIHARTESNISGDLESWRSEKQRKESQRQSTPSRTTCRANVHCGRRWHLSSNDRISPPATRTRGSSLRLDSRLASRVSTHLETTSPSKTDTRPWSYERQETNTLNLTLVPRRTPENDERRSVGALQKQDHDENQNISREATTLVDV